VQRGGKEEREQLRQTRERDSKLYVRYGYAMLWHALKRNEMHWTNKMDTRHAMPRKERGAQGEGGGRKEKVGWT